MSFTLRQKSIGWVVVLLVCAALFIGLTIKVNSVRSEVRLAERRLIALERQKLLLETEFQTRTNQQQLADWNAVDFGYKAPIAGQFVEDTRDLAELGAPKAADAPEPIQMALGEESDSGSDTAEEESFLSMVSPLTGRPLSEDEDTTEAVEEGVPAEENFVTAESLSERLARSAPMVSSSDNASAVE